MNVRGRLLGIPLHITLGIEDGERARPQPIFIDVEYLFELPQPFHDRIEQVIDYDELYQHIRTHVQASRYLLVEGVLADLKDSLIHLYPQCMAWKLTLHKPTPFPELKDLSVTVEWGR